MSSARRSWVRLGRRASRRSGERSRRGGLLMASRSALSKRMGISQDSFVAGEERRMREVMVGFGCEWNYGAEEAPSSKFKA